MRFPSGENYSSLDVNYVSLSINNASIPMPVGTIRKQLQDIEIL